MGRPGPGRPCTHQGRSDSHSFADPIRTTGCRTGGGRDDQPRRGGETVHQPEDGGQQPRPDLQKTRHQLTRRARKDHQRRLKVSAGTVSGVKRPHGPARSLLTAVGLAGLASVSSGVVARYLPVANRFVLFAAALLPYLTLTGPVSAAALALARRPRLAGGAGIIAAAAVATQATRYRTAPDSPGRELRLMTANLFIGRADCDALVDAARQAGADVLTVQEFTPEAHTRLSAAGIDMLFPYRAVDP